MKRIRNPDTGRFHTPDEAFEALLQCGALYYLDRDPVDSDGDPICIVELGIDKDAPGFDRAMNVFRATIPHQDEESMGGYFMRRPGFDYYVPANDPNCIALEKLMAPMRALLQ